MELADTSAWTARHRNREVSAEFEALARTRRLATCDVVRFELLRTTRDQHELISRREDLDALPNVAIGPRVWHRALDVLELFARQGPLHHRRVRWPDLLIAAAAERAEISVLHYDRHFELIGEVTGQPMRAIAPFGSL
jgi:predicted nucleic acid-binding protein